jgi:hypothetical protein
MSPIPEILEDWRWGFLNLYVGRPDEPLLIHPNVYKCAAFIDRKVNGQWYPAGTAFFVTLDEQDVNFHYLVTAGHVIERTRLADRSDDQIVYLRFSYTDDKYHPRISSRISDWKFHPTDDAVDAAVLSFEDRPDLFHSGVPVKEPEQVSAERKLGKWRIHTGTDVFVTGLFTRHDKQGGDLSPLPIVRTGTVARICNEDERFPLEDGTGREIKGHLLELHSIGGLSGSPVFACPMEIDHTRLALQTVHIWLGLISGHWPGDEELNQHLGISIMTPKESIMGVINHPDFVAMRTEKIRRLSKQNAPTLDDALPAPESTQQTSRGLTIPIPKRAEVLKVFKKATRKRKRD